MNRSSGLESLLRLRRNLERASELVLKKFVAEANQEKVELEKLSAQRRALRMALAAKLRAGLSAEEFAMYSETELEMAERRVTERLRALEVQRLAAEARYIRCRQDRKVIEKMVGQRRSEEQLEAGRREQAGVDEATLRGLRKNPTASNVGKSQ